MAIAARTPQRSEQRSPMRRIVIHDASNRFDVNTGLIPEGMTYEWKAVRAGGADLVEHAIMVEANGWTPVPPARHPELTGSRFVKGDFIERGSQVLMERPVEITEESKRIDMFNARYAKAAQLQKLKLDGHRAGGRGIKSTVEPPPDAIPDD